MNKPSSLLAFRIAGIPLAVPAESVQSILMPPTQLTHPPGSHGSTPGIFHHAGQVHSVIDLHPRLGISQALDQGGRLLLHEQQGRRYAFRIDTIIGLIHPEQGQWASLPPYLPRKLFWSGFLYRDEILLCTELDTLRQMHDASPLRQHLQQHLQQATPEADRPSEIPPPVLTPSTPGIPGEQLKTPEPRPAAKTNQPASTRARTDQPLPSATPERKSSNTPRDASPSKPGPRPNPVQATNLRKQSARPHPFPASTAITGNTHTTKPATPRPHIGKTNIPAPPASDPPRSVPSMDQAHDQRGDTPQQSHSLIWAMLWLLLLGAAAWGLWYLFSLTTAPGQPAYTGPAAPPAIAWQPAAPRSVTDPVPAPESRPDSMPETMPAPTASAIDDPAPSGTGQTAAALRLERDDDGILNLIIERQPQTDSTTESASTAPALREPAPGPIAIAQAEETHPESPSSDMPMDDLVTAQPTEPTPLRPEPPGPIPAAELKLDEALWLDQSSIPLAPCQCEHIVVRGDTLWSIAMRYTGNAFNYPLLARQSGIDNPDLIYPGDRIRITIR